MWRDLQGIILGLLGIPRPREQLRTTIAINGGTRRNICNVLSFYNYLYAGYKWI